MTHDEQIAALIRNGSSVYPRKLPPEALAQYVRTLGHLPIEVIDDAMQDAMRDAADHMATPAEILRIAKSIQSDRFMKRIEEEGRSTRNKELPVGSAQDILAHRTEDALYNEALALAAERFRDPGRYPPTMRGRYGALLEALESVGWTEPRWRGHAWHDPESKTLRRTCLQEIAQYRASSGASGPTESQTPTGNYAIATLFLAEAMRALL